MRLALLLLAFALPAFAQTPERITDSGLRHAYYLYVPAQLDKTKPSTILVLPNNTGSSNDDIGFHDADVARRLGRLAAAPMPIAMPVLMPVFPRPKTDWTIYTHALDRDVMTTDKADYARLDLQLLAMIDHARARLAKDGIATDPKVFLQGFSASGMFVNRFTFLHPERVKAAAVGSPGGWPLAPVPAQANERLRYPLGTSDWQQLSGKPLDLAALRQVPMFFFLGDQDDNDALPFKDGYEDEDAQLALRVLGKTPLSRWPLAEKLYREAGLQARFKLYPGVNHTVSADMRADILAFFQSRL